MAGSFAPFFWFSAAVAWIARFAFRSFLFSYAATCAASTSEDSNAAVSQVASPYPSPRHFTRYSCEGSASSASSSSSSSSSEDSPFFFLDVFFLDVFFFAAASSSDVSSSSSSSSSSSGASRLSMTRSTTRYCAGNGSVVRSGFCACRRLNDTSFGFPDLSASRSPAVSHDRRRYPHPSHLTQYSSAEAEAVFLPPPPPLGDFALLAGDFAAAACAFAARCFAMTSFAASLPSSSTSFASTSSNSAQYTIFSTTSRSSSLSSSSPSAASSSDASKSESSCSVGEAIGQSNVLPVKR